MPILANASRIGIWGFGAEGKAAFAFVRAGFPGAELTILSDAALSPADAELLSGAGRPVPVVVGTGVAAALAEGGLDVVVKSPGVSLYRPEIAAAKAHGVRFTSASNLWFEQNQAARTIVVTGTKGKSTTARLLHHILRGAGLDAALLGNVGIPALGAPPGKDYTVLELSSYQVADLAYGPDIAVVTNLYPEHAPWHGGVERYYADKLRLLSLAERTRAVCNLADPKLRAACAGRDTTWFNAPDGFEGNEDGLRYRGAPVDCASFPLKGAHNLSNLAAACTVADMVGVESCRRAVDLASFRQLKHRLEEFRVGAADLLCVDDSISTVPQATIAALKAYAGYRTVLLLGGTDRGQDYSELIDLLPATGVRYVVLLPQNGRRIEEEMRGRTPPFTIFAARNFAEGVKAAVSHALPGELVLLSPAAPSFGEFRNFEERGETFKTLCRAHASSLGSTSPDPKSPSR